MAGHSSTAEKKVPQLGFELLEMPKQTLVAVKLAKQNVSDVAWRAQWDPAPFEAIFRLDELEAKIV